MRYYVDTCIFLNVWKKEIGHDASKPVWKSSDDFIKKAIDNREIIISFAVLKELYHKLPTDQYLALKAELDDAGAEIILISRAIFYDARQIESDEKYEISFFDCIHLLIAKERRAILVTRDKKLIAIARKRGVEARTPEKA